MRERGKDYNISTRTLFLNFVSCNRFVMRMVKCMTNISDARAQDGIQNIESGTYEYQYIFNAMQFNAIYFRIHFLSPFQYGLTVTPKWISNHMHSKMCDKITYTFPKSNVASVEVLNGLVISSMLG